MSKIWVENSFDSYEKVLADKLEVASQNDDAELALNFEATMPVYEEFTQDKIDALISKIKAEKSVSFMVLFEGKCRIYPLIWWLFVAKIVLVS